MLGVKYCYLVVLLTSFCWNLLLGAKPCNEAILEKITSGPKGPDKQAYLILNSGAPNENLTQGTPIVGGADVWELRYGGGENQMEFTSPLFALDDKPDESYWITAIEIQNGFDSGSKCGSQMRSQSNYITKLKLTIRSELNTSEFVSIQAPYAAEMDNMGEPIINLQQLGFKGQGRSIRINFQPIAADAVKLNVIEFLQAPDPSESQSVCLRVEIYGCSRPMGPGNLSPPEINMEPLLQYIIPYPDAVINGYMHKDTEYTGVDSLGLLSGGAGILTDGSIGTTPSENPDLYLGWSICATNNPHIIFLFNGQYPISDFIAKLWDNENGRTVEYSDFRVYDQFENEIQFDGCTIFNASYLKIVFSYPTDSRVLLLSEVSFSNASNFDVLTGSNLTELLLAKYQSNSIDSSPSTTTLLPSVSSTTSPKVMSSSNITFQTEPTIIPAGRVDLEQDTILYIVIGILGLIVIVLLLIVVVQGMMLIRCYRSSRDRESQFYPERLENDHSEGNVTNSNPMESIRSNEARVTEKPYDLSESQVYL